MNPGDKKKFKMPAQPKNAEIIIGLVARMGVDTRGMCEQIANILQPYKYSTYEIKLTDALKELPRFDRIPQSPVEERYKSYIKACNDIRSSTKNQAAMARFGIAQIASLRPSEDWGADLFQRRAFIVNQLKNPQESELLRSVYGEHYIQISIHANHDDREQSLAKRIAGDHFEDPRVENWKTAARSLMDIDNAQEDVEYGQRVRDVFPMSDVVIDGGSPESARKDLSRFFRALFGDFRVTPTRAEYGMQLANTASLRSADLSRQVGAAIMNVRAEVQSLGCNEVPRAGGGTYWEGDPLDAREFKLGEDSNDKRKRQMLLDLAIRMRKAGMLAERFEDNETLSAELLNRSDKIIDGAQFMDSLEYGRTVHAEMNAITDAARNGHGVRDCILFCNTFPCHNCAKHIVASGIAEVVYLRPYPKSYANELFTDSIVTDPSTSVKGHISFTQFIGIVGPIYERIFSKVRWKEGDGTVPPFNKATASFIRRTPVPLYAQSEEVFNEDWMETIEGAGLMASGEEPSIDH